MKSVVACKRSKWKRDLLRYNSEEKVKELYKIQNNAYDKLYAAHTRQENAIQTIRNTLPDAVLVHREELTALDYKKFDNIISLGGDNHFVYVCSFVPDGMPIIGINSDPETSIGALLNFNINNFRDKIFSGLQSVQLQTEEWTRIECELIYSNGRIIKTPTCISEISIHNIYPFLTSRYLIRIKNSSWEEQKSSGLVLTTGAGSTGWFRNCHWASYQDSSVFPKDAYYFRLIARELNATKKYKYQHTRIEKSETLEVISEMDGQINIDSHTETVFDFPPGCTAKFTLSEKRLTVVKDIFKNN